MKERRGGRMAMDHSAPVQRQNDRPMAIRNSFTRVRVWYCCGFAGKIRLWQSFSARCNLISITMRIVLHDYAVLFVIHKIRNIVMPLIRADATRLWNTYTIAQHNKTFNLIQCTRRIKKSTNGYFTFATRVIPLNATEETFLIILEDLWAQRKIKVTSLVCTK